MSEQVNNQEFEKVLKRLNPNQRLAVDSTEGPVLVVAGPGTGKTQILSARIGNILQQGLCDAHNILCLTYTEAGTIAMRKRLLEFIGSEAYNISINTFHGFCNDVIQDNLDYFGYRDLQAAEDLEKIDIAQKIIDGFDNDHPLKRFKGEVYYDANRLLNLYELIKREGWSVEDLSQQIKDYLELLPELPDFQYKTNRGAVKKGDPKTKDIEKERKKYNGTLAAMATFNEYQERLQKRKRYDFSDMILWVINAFKDNNDLLLQYQERYQYVLVDEYQDTNGSQNEILDLLCSYWDQPNVFVVGDDDQAIYRFQGASIGNIQEFYNKYSPEVVVLDENYRSVQNILDASTNLIEKNTNRLVNHLDGLNKDLKASHPELKPLDIPVEIRSYFNEYHEEAALLQELKSYSGDLSKVAVIYRNHSKVENLVKALVKAEVPLNINRKVNALDLALVKQLLDILEYIDAEHNIPFRGEHHLFEMLHFPYVGIALNDIVRIIRFKVENKEIPYREIIGSPEHLISADVANTAPVQQFSNAINHWIKNGKELTLQVLFEEILTQGKVLDELMQRNDRTFQLQAVSTLFDLIKDESAKNPSFHIPELLDHIKKMKANNVRLNVNQVIYSDAGVNFITAHSSKGLEFERVYILGANKDNWEGKRANNSGFSLPKYVVGGDAKEDLVEDERRLFFVAASRAEKELVISFSDQRLNGKDLEQSRFVEEMTQGQSLDTEVIALTEETILDYQVEIMQRAKAPEPPLIDHELVDRKLQKFSLNATALNKYLKCPLSYYFENLLRIPSARNANMGFGSAIHYGLEKYFDSLKEAPETPVEELIAHFHRGMELSISHFTKQELERLSFFGEKILKEYHDFHKDEWNTFTLQEYRTGTIDFEGIPLTGSLDKVEFDGQKITVVDYKTGKIDSTWTREKTAGPSDKNPIGGDYWRQVLFYKVMMDAQHVKPWEMVSGILDFVEPTKEGAFKKVQITIDPEGLGIVKDQIRSAYQGIMNKHFTGCGEPDCQWCTFVRTNFDSSSLRLGELEDGE